MTQTWIEVILLVLFFSVPFVLGGLIARLGDRRNWERRITFRLLSLGYFGSAAAIGLVILVYLFYQVR